MRAFLNGLLRFYEKKEIINSGYVEFEFHDWLDDREAALSPDKKRVECFLMQMVHPIL